MTRNSEDNVDDIEASEKAVKLFCGRGNEGLGCVEGMERSQQTCVGFFTAGPLDKIEYQLSAFSNVLE
ncbi:hypothetical protein P7K49_012739, partial [Saguinus oedipus]